MANKTFDFKKPLLDMRGKPTIENGEELTVAEGLNDAIMSSRITEEELITKFFIWGPELIKTGKLSLDKVDEDKLKKWIMTNPQILTLGKMRINEIFDNPVPK